MGNYDSALRRKFEQAKREVLPFTEVMIFPSFENEAEKILAQLGQINRLLAGLDGPAPSKLISFDSAPDLSSVVFEAIQFFHENEPKLLKLAGESKVMSTVHPLIKADLNTLQADLLKLIKDQSQLPVSMKNLHLSSAANCARRLHSLFTDKQFYLRKYPQAFTPFLFAFILIYVPIVGAEYQNTQPPSESTRKDFLEQVSQLRGALHYFADEANRGLLDRRIAAVRHYYANEPEYTRMGPTKAQLHYTTIYDELLQRTVYVDYGFTINNATTSFSEAKRNDPNRIIVSVTGTKSLPVNRPYTDLSPKVKAWYIEMIQQNYGNYFKKGFEALDKLVALANGE